MTTAPAAAPSGARTLIFLCDGTWSSDAPGQRSNVGRLYKLLKEVERPDAQLQAYDRGIQGVGLRGLWNAATGRDINRSILAGYRFLAQAWRPGDLIFLFGYSRGAYAVRSLAGMIGTVGLLKGAVASEARLEEALSLYQNDDPARAGRAFRMAHCHAETPIEMMGLWDTVKALGPPFPILSRLAPMATEFHDDQLGTHIRHGYHALAADETRTAFSPRLWRRSPDWRGRVEQWWFPGTHGDVGGDIRNTRASRGVGNITLNWMLGRAESHGAILPGGWEKRFDEDPTGRFIDTRRGVSAGFVLRKPRVIGGADGETLHLSIRTRETAVPGYRHRARWEAP